VVCRTAERESPDLRHAGPTPQQPSGNGRRRAAEPEERVRERASEFQVLTRRCEDLDQRDTQVVARPLKRNPTAVQSGNRQATPLGERSRRTQARSTVRVRFQATDISRRVGRGGPRPGAACRKNRPDTGTGPCGDIASHFMGLSVLLFVSPIARTRASNGRSIED